MILEKKPSMRKKSSGVLDYVPSIETEQEMTQLLPVDPTFITLLQKSSTLDRELNPAF